MLFKLLQHGTHKFHICKSFSSVTAVIENKANICLAGRDFVDANYFSADEIKSLLWTAFDMQNLSLQRSTINCIDGAKITLLLKEPSLRLQLPAANAAQLLNANLNVVVDPKWDEYEFITDLGHLLAKSSDLVLCHSDKQSKISQLADGADVPVVTVYSNQFAMIQTLADVMAIQGHYGKLKRLTLAWVGPSRPLLNSHMSIMPRLGIDMKYACVNEFNKPVSPPLLDVARKDCQRYNTEMHECTCASSAIYRSDIIATTKHNCKAFQITYKDIKEAAVKWSFLHELPRGEAEAENQIFCHKNSLVWKSVSNMQWIYAALFVRLLKSYEHVTREPLFEDNACNI